MKFIRVIFTTGLIVCFFITVAGIFCTGAAAETIFDKTVTVSQDGYHQFSFSTDPRDELSIRVKTDGAPVAYFFMNQADFMTYKEAYKARHKNVAPIKLTSMQNKYYIRDRTFYVTVTGGRFTVVIDNSQIPDYGQDTKRDVKVRVTIDRWNPSYSELQPADEPGIFPRFDPNKLRDPRGVLKDPSKIWGG